jgi:peptide-methionine (S)-S-oxide reductase
VAVLLVLETGGLAAPNEASKPVEGAAVATFAGGCFWCMEHPFDRIDGVLETTVGYTGGHDVDPTYEKVSAGKTGHAEAVQVRFDPARVSYERLLAVFWRNIDPLTPAAQFCDHGSQYRSAIFYHDDAQAIAARASKQALADSGRFGDRPIVTEIVEAGPFYPAETYHQDYAEKNPIRYRFYRYGCGRDARLEELWGNEAGGASSEPGDEATRPE